MSGVAYTVGDSATMLRRSLRRLLRYPSLTLLLVGMPIVFLLLFVYVFGGQLSNGLGTSLTVVTLTVIALWIFGTTVQVFLLLLIAVVISLYLGALTDLFVRRLRMPRRSSSTSSPTAS